MYISTLLSRNYSLPTRLPRLQDFQKNDILDIGLLFPNANFPIIIIDNVIPMLQHNALPSIILHTRMFKLDEHTSSPGIPFIFTVVPHFLPQLFLFKRIAPKTPNRIHNY